MENNCTQGARSPPAYGDHGYELLKEEMEFRNHPSLQVQSTVVTIIPEGPPVRDHIIWSLFNAMYLNFCCLGVIALAYSVKSRDRKQLGDKNGATSFGSTARSLNIAATVLSILVLIVVITFYAFQMAKLIEMFQEASRKEQEHRIQEFEKRLSGK